MNRKAPCGSRNCDIVAVIPAYNEELTIGSVVLKTRKHVSRVIVVDDGSVDQTSEIASMAGAEVIRLGENRGKAFAVKRGLKEIESRDSVVAVTIDADGQHDPTDIEKVVRPILRDEADLVIGSRLIENGHSIPAYRKIGQRILNRVTNVGSKKKVTDTQSGFRALSTSGIQNMGFSSNGYDLESGMIIHFASMGLRIKEVPVSVNYNVPHKHKKNPVSMGFGLMNYLVTVISLKRPLMFIGIPGLMLGLTGLFLGVISLSGKQLLGGSWIFQAVLAGFLATFGALLIVSGLTLNSIAHVISSNDKDKPKVEEPKVGESTKFDNVLVNGGDLGDQVK